MRETKATAPQALVVDDNVDVASGLAKLLTLWGYEVHVAHDGLSALRLARDVKPKVVLLDIGLPDVSGYEVAYRLRNENGKHDMTIIGVTGCGHFEGMETRGVSALDHCLLKPVSSGVLRQLLAQGNG